MNSKIDFYGELLDKEKELLPSITIDFFFFILRELQISTTKL